MTKLEYGPVEESIDTLYLCKHYEDEIFRVLNPSVRITQLLNMFNSAQAKVKFTAEMEWNHEMEFLDVLLIHRGVSSVQSPIHRKAARNKRYIQLHSFVPLRVKKNLIRRLIDRTKRHMHKRYS